MASIRATDDVTPFVIRAPHFLQSYFFYFATLPSGLQCKPIFATKLDENPEISTSGKFLR